MTFQSNVPEEADEEQQAILEQIPVIRQRTNTTGIAWRHRFASTTAPGQITTSLSTTNYYNEFLRYRDNVNQTGLFSSNQATERWHTLRTDARWFLDDLTVSTGGQVRWNLYRNDFRDENTGADFNTDLDFISYGLFAQASWEPRGTPWSLTGGVRADANSFTGNALWTTLSPRLSARARLDQDGRWLLNASVGRYYKMPTATLLGYQVAGSFVNPDLKYIQSDHFTVGLDHFVRASTKLSVEGSSSCMMIIPFPCARGSVWPISAPILRYWAMNRWLRWGRGRTLRRGVSIPAALCRKISLRLRLTPCSGVSSPVPTVMCFRPSAW